MMKSLIVALLSATVTSIPVVQAQTGTASAFRPKGAKLLNEDYLTSTGKTVAHPGVSQGAATTDLDRRIEQQNDRVSQSICSNCNE